MTAQLATDEVEAVRTELKDFLRSRPDLTMTDLIPYTTFSDCTIRSFAGGQIRGGREVVSQVRDVLRKARAGEILTPGNGASVVLTEDAEARVRRVRKQHQFYETQTVRKIGEVLDFCAEHAAIGVVTADFGVGKTEAVKAWRRGRGRKTEAIVIEFNEFTRSNKVYFVQRLARMLGLDFPAGAQNAAYVFDAITDELNARPRLLVFDQCETMQVKVAQIIRQIWDRTHEAGVGVTLLAAPILATRMLGARVADLGALTSRVGVWAMLNGITRSEMAAILKQEGLGDVDEAAFDLWYRAAGGSMRRVMRTLELLQSRHAGKRITERTIQGVAEHLWGMSIRTEVA